MNQLSLINEPDILYINKVILYGAGYNGRNTQEKLNLLGIETAFFCDSDNDKCNAIIDGRQVISVPKLKELDDACNIIIIITTLQSEATDQIINTLKGLHLRTEKIYTAFTLDVSIMQNIYHFKITDSSRQAFINRYLGGIEILKNRQIREKKNVWKIGRIIQHMENHFRGTSDILIYQAGKVGSTTIFKSLLECGVPCIHLHLIQEVIGNSEELKNLIASYRDNIKSGSKLKIITPIRDPLSRNISAYMYEFESFGLRINMDVGESFIDSMFAHLTSFHDWIWRWFDNELKQVFDIDVYKHPFDKERGYSIIRQDNIEVLIFQLEKMKSLEKLIGEFTGVPHLKFVDANSGDELIYKDLYRDIKKSIHFPEEILSLYYGSHTRTQYFYSESDINIFKKKWSSLC